MDVLSLRLDVLSLRLDVLSLRLRRITMNNKYIISLCWRQKASTG